MSANLAKVLLYRYNDPNLLLYRYNDPNLSSIVTVMTMVFIYPL